MDNVNKQSLNSFDGLKQLRLKLDQHNELLRMSYSILLKEKKENYDVLAPLLYSIIDSNDSIAFLSQKGKVRDCFVLARTIYETTVNFCFICAKGKETVERARSHAIQKSFRDLHRELEIGTNRLKVDWQGGVDLSAHPEIEKALKIFTNKQGREITSWTPETVKEEIDAINDKFGKNVSGNLQFGLIAIYRHASEIAHGTLFGALFSIGLTSPNGKPKTPQELMNFQCENLDMLLLMLVASMNSILIVLATQLPIQEQVDISEKLIKEIANDNWLYSTKIK
jgi:hypothetical protein